MLPNGITFISGKRMVLIKFVLAKEKALFKKIPPHNVWYLNLNFIYYAFLKQPSIQQLP